jgi:hypothetical protein
MQQHRTRNFLSDMNARKLVTLSPSQDSDRRAKNSAKISETQRMQMNFQFILVLRASQGNECTTTTIEQG